MADAEKTKKVFVRLTRDFPAGQSHTRGGVTLGAGPRPVEAEVTADQLDALKGDHYVEIVDAKEFKKWDERLGEEALPTSADLANDESTKSRNYGNGNDEGSGDGSDGSDGDEGDGNDAPELNADMKLVDLQAEATKRGVPDADQIRSKQGVLDAIEAHENDNSSDGE